MTSTSSSAGSTRRTAVKTLQAVIGVGLAAALIVWGMPAIGKTSWPEIFHNVGRISWWHLVVFFVLLMGSLWCYTFLITGSLPGIDHRRALTVNLAATAVSNLLPAGGVMGIAATYMMCRSWRLPKKETSTSLIIAGVWNVLVRIAMPVVALLLLLTSDKAGLPNYFIQITTLLVIGGIGIVALFVAAIVSDRAAALVGHLADQTLGALQRRRGREISQPYDERMREWQHHMSGVVTTKWFEMTAGMTGFFFFLFILFWECMAAVGVELSWQRMFVAFAIGRLVTAFPITPGSMGATEFVALTVMAAFGASGSQATAGILLFMICSTLAQIPLGGVAWMIWFFGPRDRGGSGDDEPPPDPHLLRHPRAVASEVFAQVEGHAGASAEPRPAPEAPRAPSAPAESPDA